MSDARSDALVFFGATGDLAMTIVVGAAKPLLARA